MRMSALDEMMDRQKLMRMTERSDRMYLCRNGPMRGEETACLPVPLSTCLSDCPSAQLPVRPSACQVSTPLVGVSPPDGHVDDDEQQQRQRGDPTAHDQRHRRQLQLLHVLKGREKQREVVLQENIQHLCR